MLLFSIAKRISYRRGVFIGFLLCWSILLADVALACQPDWWEIRISCTPTPLVLTTLDLAEGEQGLHFVTLNDDATFVKSEDYEDLPGHISDSYGRLSVGKDYLVIQQVAHEMAPLFVERISAFCREDLRPVQSQITTLIQSHQDGLVELYIQEKEDTLARLEHEYFHCKYRKYEVIEQWIISTETVRPYCNQAGLCGGYYEISFISLFLFLLQNIQVVTLPYLGIYVFVAGVILLALLYLRKRGETWAFLEPGMIHLGVVVPIIVFMVVTFILSIQWLVAAYMVACIIRYAAYRIKNHRTIDRAL